MDIDELIKHVKKQAEQLEHEQPQEFKAQVVNTVVAPVEKKRAGQKPETYHLNDFLLYDNDTFLNMAYQVVLHRLPDKTGLQNSLRYLQKGGSKQSLLADIMLSDEGLEHNVTIAGMDWLLLRTRLIKKLGYLGRMLKPLIILPDHIFKPRITPTVRKLLDIEKQNIQTQQMLDEEMFELKQNQQQQFESLQQQYDTSIIQNEKLLQQLHNSLAQVRMQFNYQQRNQDAFLQELIQRSYVDTAEQGEPKQAAQEVLNAHKNDKLDAYYVAFEDACRGTREEIRNNLSNYLPYIKDTGNAVKLTAEEPVKIIDLGCGRGEWLELLNEQGWQAQGVDLNKVMVQDCQNQGLQATQEDVIDYLNQQASNSQVAVTAFHIIEHIPFASLLALFEESIRVLKPGGIIIFETPNPENILVGSHTFYHDPTHRNPITPTSVQFLAQYTGFCRIEIVRLHPYPEAARVPGNEPVTERVNGHLCGPQDYAIIAHKPE